MRPGAAFALLFGFLAVVPVFVAIWTTATYTFAVKTLLTAFVLGMAAAGSYFADLGSDDDA